MLKVLALLIVGISTQYMMIDDHIRKFKDSKNLIINAWLLPCLVWVMIYVCMYFLIKAELM